MAWGLDVQGLFQGCGNSSGDVHGEAGYEGRCSRDGQGAGVWAKCEGEAGGDLPNSSFLYRSIPEEMHLGVT